MMSKQEVMGFELRRIPQDICSMNCVPTPFALLDENTCNDLHAELHSFNSAESRPFSSSSRRHMDDGLVKATITWKPFGDGMKYETNGQKYSGTTRLHSQNWKSFTMTDPYKNAPHREKENMESGSEWTRGSLDFPTQSCSTDGKRLQSEALSKLFTSLDVKAVDKVNEGVGGACSWVGDDKLMNDWNAISQNLSTVPSAPIVGKPNRFLSQRGESDSRWEDSLCFGPADHSIQTSIIASCEHAPLTSSACLFEDESVKIMGAHSCNSMRPELANVPVLSQSRSIDIEDSQACEEICAQEDDHLVVLFAEQNTSKGNTGRIRQELLKLSSLCMRYSRRILSSINSLVREQSIKQSLQHVQQTFSSNPRRRFVKLNSQKLPEFSSKVSSVSSNRKLAKDKELKAVLMKINDVFTSMDRAPLTNVQEAHANPMIANPLQPIANRKKQYVII